MLQAFLQGWQHPSHLSGHQAGSVGLRLIPWWSSEAGFGATKKLRLSLPITTTYVSPANFMFAFVFFSCTPLLSMVCSPCCIVLFCFSSFCPHTCCTLVPWVTSVYDVLMIDSLLLRCRVISPLCFLAHPIYCCMVLGEKFCSVHVLCFQLFANQNLSWLSRRPFYIMCLKMFL